MTIQRVKERLANSNHPIAEALHKGDHFKVLIIGFKKEMVLREHKTKVPAKLVVVEGSVKYIESENVVPLNLHEEKEIPVNVLHSVEALTDSLCILIQG